MKSPLESKRLRQIIVEIEKDLRRLAMNGRNSPGVQEDVDLGLDFCRRAREHLKGNEVEAAFFKIMDAKTQQASAHRSLNEFDGLVQRIRADLLESLPEVRRKIVQRRYPRFARIVKQEGRRW